MATETEIANMALVHVGSARIIDFNDPVLEQAKKVRDVWDISRREFLSEANWRTHKTRVNDLGRLLAAPVFKWAYQFQLPNDFLRIYEFNQVDIYDEDYQDLFQLEDRTLVTDEEEADIGYIRDDENVSLMSGHMASAFAMLVGSYIAVSLRQDEGLAQALRQDYDTRLLPKAKRLSSIQKKVKRWDPARGSRLVKARTYSTND